MEEIGFHDKFTIKEHPNLLDRKNPDNSPEQKKEYQDTKYEDDGSLSVDDYLDDIWFNMYRFL